jgi:serine/threonine protein kinase
MAYSLHIGQTLDGRFKITDLIGKGGMASVYEAIDCSTGQMVALKVPHLHFESDPGFYSRFQREEEIGRFLRHPSILRVLPVGERSRPYIVMERLDGKLLSVHLAESGQLPVPEAVGIAVRIAEVLNYMHGHKVIHRDLKPKNVMLCADGTLRVIDLGLAKGEAFRSVTIFGLSSMMGSSDYVSPEQARGRGGDERSDIYSLGAVLYKMVTGLEPFPGSSPLLRMHARLVGDPVAPTRLNPAVPPELEEVILHAMARVPKDRYESAAQMKDELLSPERVVLTGRPARLKAPSPWKIWWRRMRIHVWATLGVLGFMAMLYALAHCGSLRWQVKS